jgi:hypothetical protein
LKGRSLDLASCGFEVSQALVRYSLTIHQVPHLNLYSYQTANIHKGKTVIFNSIIHEVCDNQPGVQVVFFYCKNNDRFRSSSAEIAKGLILQVLEQDSNCLDFIYESILKNGSKDSSIYVPMLKEILLTHDSLYVGLDGLDECPEQDRKILSDLIMNISAEKISNSGVRTLVTSRKEKDLEKRLYSAAILDIKPQNLEYDITEFVRLEMSQLSRTFSFSSEREESVTKEICTRPRGRNEPNSCNSSVI